MNFVTQTSKDPEDTLVNLDLCFRFRSNLLQDANKEIIFTIEFLMLGSAQDRTWHYKDIDKRNEDLSNLIDLCCITTKGRKINPSKE